MGEGKFKAEKYYCSINEGIEKS